MGRNPILRLSQSWLFHGAMAALVVASSVYVVAHVDTDSVNEVPPDFYVAVAAIFPILLVTGLVEITFLVPRSPQMFVPQTVTLVSPAVVGEWAALHELARGASSEDFTTVVVVQLSLLTMLLIFLIVNDAVYRWLDRDLV